MLLRRADVLAIWIAAVVACVAVLALVPAQQRPQGLTLALAGCVVLTLAVQVFLAEKDGFVTRLMVSTIGALAVTLLAALAAVLLP